MSETETPRDRVLRVYQECGSIRETARRLGLAKPTVQGHLRRAGIKAKPIAAPMLEPADGQLLKGTSSLVRVAEDGSQSTVLQWVKTDVDRGAKVDALRQAIDGICKDLPRAKPIAAPRSCDDDLMCVIPIGDPHIGMLSWAAETGESWDLIIAERVLIGAVEKAVALAPSAGRCLLINLGDFFHSDSQENRTARSGNQLDVDSRWARVLEVGIRIERRMIELCLAKFKRVDVDNVRGNHDDHSSVMLAHVMNAYFERNKRVSVCMNPSLHHYWEHGACLIGTHHGHQTRKERLGALMAATQPEAWGRTTHRRIYRGHEHSDSLREEPGVIVETMNTLAARDAYAAGSGYVSGRDLKIDTWHKKHGLVNRHIIGLSTLGITA
jgi:hypothetical protein